MTLKQLAEKLGKSPLAVMNKQKSFGLPVIKEYSTGYAVLLGKLINLSACAVPKKDITALLSRERKLLELLKVDSLTNSPLWFEDLCVDKFGPTRLLLSGYDMGHVVNRSAVQTGLDFAERDSELFNGKEMGVDVLRALQNCMESQEKVLSRLRQEIPGLATALKWSRKITA
ncbi:MAG: hypothetical protein H8E68_00175 [Kiritimatiellaeota bacterium]|nr:hypothetical protein [Kiritimatiellota bacterium]